MRTRLSVVIATVLASLAWCAAACATVTTSTLAVGSPTGAYLLDDQVTPNEAITLAGTSNGTSTDALDIRCYYGASSSSVLASDIPVRQDGSFSYTSPIALRQIAGETCVMRAVPHGDSSPHPPGSPSPYAGPTLSIDQRSEHLISGGANNGDLEDYHMFASQLGGGFGYDSLGDCSVESSYAYDPVTFAPSRLDDCNAYFSGANGAGTRSELQVDGADAYLPGNIQFLAGNLTGIPGFPSLSYAYSLDPATGNLTITETDRVVKCNPGGSYPPSGGSCSSFVPTGVQVAQHVTQSGSGRVATVVQYFSSTDGQAHTVDLLEDNRFADPGDDGELDFPWTGAGMQEYTIPGQTVASPGTAGPGSIYLKGSASVPDGGEQAPQGSVTFSDPPSGVLIVQPTTQSQSRLELHYLRRVPATGSVALAFTYSDAFLASEVAGYAAAAQAALRPSIAISSPRPGTRTTRATQTVSGTASDTNGLSDVTVDGRIVPVAPNGAWTTTVSLRPGQNTISAAAINIFGAVGQAQTAIDRAARGPSLSAVSQAHGIWSEQGPRGRHRPPVGTSFGFSLSRAAQVTFSFTQPRPGRVVGHRCVTPIRRNAHRPRCTQTVSVAALSLQGHAGRNRLRFAGVVHGRQLSPGRYTVVIVAADAGVTSSPRLETFTIVP